MAAPPSAFGSDVDGAPPTRRRVLVAGTALAVTGLLAACGGSEDTAGTAGSSPSTGETTSPGSAGTALVPTSEVPVGAGVVLESEKVVVTQPSEGTFKAFTAVCTHQGCTVAGVKDGVISCPCHGSTFDASDGSVKNGPATRPLKEIAVTVEGGEVVRA